MKTKRFLFATAATVMMMFAFASCTAESVEEDDQIQLIDKEEYEVPPNG